MTTMAEVPQNPGRFETMPETLSLKAVRDRGKGRVDGAWRPRSHDLSTELPALIEELDQHWGRVTRITVNPAMWNAVPRTVAARGHAVKVGWFEEEQDEHVICLLSYGIRRLDLLVIPPEMQENLAQQVMTSAVDPSGIPPLEQLLAFPTPRSGVGNATTVTSG